MGDVFLRALSADLTQTQRALAPLCLFCVPQPRSLLADEALTQDVLYTHFLTPAGADDALERRLGEYETLNGKQVAVVGSHIHTGKGFRDRRQVRILLSEKREICNQEVTVLHISRPLEGGIEVPEDPSEIDVATFRKYTAILRSFPENELVFYQLDETISQVHKICVQEQVYERYRQTLPANLREEWEAAVEELIHAGSFDDVEEDYRLQRRHGGGVSHLLQIQQVVECYLMESLHDLVFPKLVESCQEQDRKLQQVMYRMRHYTPEDFGLRKEFQCFAAEARDTLLTVIDKKTPLDMLLVFKACIDRVSDAITRNVKLRRLDFEAYQLTTDDILDQLLFVLVQAFNQVMRGPGADAGSAFPIAAVIKYISDYHFINSNTTALGFTIANFQVAIEYFLMRGNHDEDCKDCGDLALQGGSAGIHCSQIIEESKCVQATHRIRRDLMRALENVELARRDTGTDTGQESPHLNMTDPTGAAAGDAASMKQLAVIGEWSSSDENEKVEDTSDETLPGSRAVHPVELVVDGKQTLVNDSNVLQVSGGQRFFAAITEDGDLFTWGDRSGGRLGYAPADGEPRRVACPQRVFALEQQTIIQVACGAFHTLVTDLNGHVFAWGSNSRGQLGFLSPATPSTAVEIPTVVADLRGTYMSSVACGEYHSLALSSDGRVFSWGCNKYGELGRPAEGLLDMAQPRQLGADWTGWAMDLKSRIGAGEKSVVRRIAAGKDHSLAISSDGAGFTWGRGDSGQLGHGCYMDVSEPKQVMAISAAISDTCGLADIAGGNGFSLFLLQNGTAYICGRDPSLEADTLHLSPTLLTLPQPLEREFFGQITAVSCGDVHYALLSKSGALLQSYASFSQPSADAGSTTAEVEERRVAWLKEAGTVRRMVCGASHTLVVV
ncbi:putative E3 ubiquitin-protein ligase HERC3 [Phytophthora ramorum]|uniref:putative E3 ubiquitin-protein ligase HERC3 n=1 Tax=Phytophthora ramorum TaxID=164328 RepID=UPI003097F4A3|nr:putative E3 ubiquitin-protein ligase HERC3 [Phytophthora ramorum]